VLICLTAASCGRTASVRLYAKGIDFSKYKRVYYSVYRLNGYDYDELLDISMDLDSYLIRQLGFGVPQTKFRLLKESDEYEDFLVSVRDRRGSLFIRSESEYGKSIPPRPRREFDGLIWNHRKKTTVWLIDIETSDILAVMKYERTSFNGEIPEQIMYRLLTQALKEGKTFLELK
jgi:hypothetical protein